MKTFRLTSRQTQIIGLSLIACHLALTAFSAWVHAPVVDEIAYMPAGISHWQFSDFQLYRANPPLVRMVATLPAVALGYKEDWANFSNLDGERSEFPLGMYFIRENREHAFWLVTLGRWMCLPFTLLGAMVCWQWSTKLYGRYAGLLSLTLWCLCPNILGNAALLTPDIAGTSLGMAALYAYWNWSRSCTWQGAILLGILVGLALLTKFTSLLIVVMIALVFCSQWLLSWPVKLPQRARAIQLIAAGVLAILVVNLCFGFQGTLRRLGDFKFTSRSLTGQTSTDTMLLNAKTGNRFQKTLLAKLPVPFPEQFVLGIDVQKAEFDRAKPAYLFGKWQLGGWWYYYLVCMIFKVPLGFFAIFAICFYGLLLRPGSVLRRDFLVLMLMVVSLYFISVNTGVNRHFRYVLPVLGAAYVWAGSALRLRPRVTWAKQAALVCCCLFGLAGLSVFPHSQSYFNYLAGGWRGGYRYLQGSNVEWGQDLFFLKRWLHENEARAPLFVAWPSTYIHPSILGLDITPPPRDLTPGWYVMPFKNAYSRSGKYAAFRDMRPSEYIAHSIAVYEVKSPLPSLAGDDDNSDLQD